MTRCEIVTTSDGTKAIVCFDGPGLTADDVAELNRFAAMRTQSNKYYRARVATKMLLRDAAAKLGLSPKQLGDFEHGRAEIPKDMAAQMDELYATPNPGKETQ